MNSPSPKRSGHTLVELIVALVVLALLIAFAVPQLRLQVQRYYARGALDTVVAEIYRTRMIAVEGGRSAHLMIQPNRDGCVQRLTLRLAEDPPSRAASVDPRLPGLCMRHSGDTVLTFNSRGILRPPARSFYVAYGGRADSVVLSIAGRVRRTYRRKRR